MPGVGNTSASADASVLITPLSKISITSSIAAFDKGSTASVSPKVIICFLSSRNDASVCIFCVSCKTALLAL